MTCSKLGGITSDDLLIADELAARGARVVPVVWDAGEPPAVECFVVRSPWDYHLAPDAFLAWVERASRIAPLYNECTIIRWNAHKRYLLELAAAGVRVAPTVLCEAGGRYDLRAVVAERGWHEVVIKPAISASSYMTAIVGATPHPALQHDGLNARFLEDGQQHLEAILATRDVLVQPFMPEIFTRGERSLVYIGGRYSHCVQKDAFTTEPGGGRGVEADAAERELAERALRVLPMESLYARVDLLRNADGDEFVMELELIDPELYIRYSNDGARRFADALLAKVAPANAGT